MSFALFYLVCLFCLLGLGYSRRTKYVEVRAESCHDIGNQVHGAINALSLKDDALKQLNGDKYVIRFPKINIDTRNLTYKALTLDCKYVLTKLIPILEEKREKYCLSLDALSVKVDESLREISNKLSNNSIVRITKRCELNAIMEKYFSDVFLVCDKESHTVSKAKEILPELKNSVQKTTQMQDNYLGGVVFTFLCIGVIWFFVSFLFSKK